MSLLTACSQGRWRKTTIEPLAVASCTEDQPAMNTLYHYTSLNGVLGMLHSRSVWASHVSYLNDASEFRHGLSFAKQIAGSIFMNDDYLAAFGWAARHALGAVSADSLYVACFSEKADLLSQWRGYCPSGAGVCLGFDADHLSDFCEERGYRLEKCIYTHEEQIRQVESLVSGCFERFPKPLLSRQEYQELAAKGQVEAEVAYRYQTSDGPDTLQANAATAWLSAEIEKLTPLFKHEGFHEEAEWRIVAKEPREKLKFRAGSSYLVPYVELEVFSESAAGSALRDVIIGPNPNQMRCAKSVEMLLGACGLGDVDVKASPLPFNSW